MQLLETIDVEARLELAIAWAREVLADLELKDKIRSEVGDDLDKQQREMLLRRQMDAIRKELGDGDEDAVAEYRTKLADLELHRHRAQPRSRRSSTGWSAWVSRAPSTRGCATGSTRCFELPWGNYADEHANLGEAREVLDADHEGLDKVKERILEFLAVRVLRRERGLGTVCGRGSGAILVLVGPPGVGKTSLGESVARALGRPFVRVAVGGVRDEAEIRGHRRTYVGSRPGRIVRALTEAGTMNPVAAHRRDRQAASRRLQR